MKSSRLISFVLTLSIVVALIFSIAIPVSAAGGGNNISTTATGYKNADEVVYKTSGKYVYNWGARGEVATFLSKYAVSYYAQNSNYSYDYLSTLAGGADQSSAPGSALYGALKSMMETEHTHTTGYSETKDQYRYTDCVSSNTSQISSFYSGTMMGSSWGSGWNREHTWPNSKGLDGSDENDIMMLRPTLESENSSRGNTAYGESSGFFDPGKTQRGDVARIMLYTYTRWGNTSRMWGSNGVMENLTVLLKWMEEDPVDTWEMGRNDAVEQITGVRNVFVDYPEYAFLLFGRDVPENYSSPSKLGGTAVNPGGGNGDGGNGGGNSGETTATLTDITSASDIKENTAYKFYLNQTAKDAKYYLAGGMSGYYMATTTDLASAKDVYAEIVTGGFKLYIMDGTSKLYLAIEKSVDGKHTNAVFNSTGSVLAFDAEYATFIGTISDGDYFFGTYNDYVTFGASAVSKIESSYVGHLAVVTTGSNGGGTTTPHTHSYGAWSVVTAATETSEGLEKRTCSCGAYETRTIDKLSDGSTTPPVSGDITVGTPYYITSTVGQGTTYFSGTVNNGRIDGVIGSSGAIAVMLETAEGGYYITFTVGGAKKYLSVNTSGKSSAFVFADSADANCIWLVDTDAKTIISKAIGNRGIATKTAEATYTNFSTYSTQNLGSSEYTWAWFVPVNSGTTPDNPGTGETPHTHTYGAWVTVTEPTATSFGLAKRTCTYEGCTASETKSLDKLAGTDTPHTHTYGAWVTVKEPTETEEGLEQRTCVCGHTDERAIDKLPATPKFDTPEDIVNAAWNLGLGETLGTQTLSGVVISIDTEYSEQFKNITFTIVVAEMTDKPIVCYRVKGADGTDTAAVKVGDTVTVTGELLNYSKGDEGTVEFNSGSTFVFGEVEPPHEHEFGEWTVVTPATETAEGLEERKCSCGETESRKIDKIEKPATPPSTSDVEKGCKGSVGASAIVVTLVGAASVIGVAVVRKKKED